VRIFDGDASGGEDSVGCEGVCDIVTVTYVDEKIFRDVGVRIYRRWDVLGETFRICLLF